MTLRVVHCGIGNIGSYALRAILAHPDLELVGQYVGTEAKAGSDAGVLVGVDPVGVVATNDWSELLSLNADGLTYFGDSIGREQAAIENLCRCLSEVRMS